MIGFPEPLLGLRPQRLAVLYSTDDWLALDKPAGIQILSDNWYPKVPVLTEAINYQAGNEKPELQRLGIGSDGVRAVYSMEPDMSGVALFAKNHEAGEYLKNEYGSEAFQMTIEFISEESPEGNEFFCKLPIARHGAKAEVLVSHRTGKQAKTHFVRQEKLGRYGLWHAHVTFYRMHQLFVHAREVGLLVMGDQVYGRSRPLYLSQIKRNYRSSQRREERPLFDGCAMHLRELEGKTKNGDNFSIVSPRPSKLNVLIKRLRDFG